MSCKSQANVCLPKSVPRGLPGKGCEMFSDVLVCLGHLMYGDAPRVVNFRGGSICSQTCHKLTGRYGVLWCQPLHWMLHWMVMVVFGTLPLSTGQVCGTAGKAY